MRQRIVRLALVGGVFLLALILLPAACGGGRTVAGGPDVPRSTGPSTRLNVPPGYRTDRGWEVTGAGPDYALSHTTGRLAYLEAAPDHRYRLRTLDTETGRSAWSGEAWRPPDPRNFPKLLTVDKDDRQFFVTWSYGKTGIGPEPSGTFVSLDVYDVVDGKRRRVEVPWAGAPVVTATGPGIVITDGGANSAVVDPVSGEVSDTAASAVTYPKGCAACKRLTEVRGQTSKGLLLSGAREFWVEGGWFSRRTAPKGADAGTGVPTSVTPGLVLAKWQLAKKSKRAATHQLWTVHDAESGKPVVSVECRTPAMEPGRYPQAAVSPSGDYLIAGNLAFDLKAKKGFCLEKDGGSPLLTFASVTDGGIAYGATTVRDADEALNGGGAGPVTMSFVTEDIEELPPNTRLPEVETSDVGVFRWTDGRNRLHLLGYPRVG
uniref:Lipoprotein n=1 Tax=Streptomyces sp. NBC_01401 TaxID=2903854 RepID=A0AAU3H2B9_9ACTN